MSLVDYPTVKGLAKEFWVQVLFLTLALGLWASHLCPNLDSVQKQQCRTAPSSTSGCGNLGSYQLL